jgi:WD40 repeat protein
VTGSSKNVKIWDTSTGECLATIKGNNSTSVCFLYARVVIGSNDGTIKIWDSISKKSLHVFDKVHGAAVLCVDVLPNGNIITGSADKTTKTWNPNNGRCLLTLIGHTQIIGCLKVLRDGEGVATGSLDGTVRIWDTHTGKCKLTLEVGKPVFCLEVLPDNNRLVVGCENNIIHIWEVSTGKCFQTMNNSDHHFAVTSLGVLPCGNIISGSDDGTIRLWDKNIVISTWRKSYFLFDFAVCPNGNVVIFCPYSVIVWSFF